MDTAQDLFLCRIRKLSALLMCIIIAFMTAFFNDLFMKMILWTNLNSEVIVNTQFFHYPIGSVS